MPKTITAKIRGVSPMSHSRLHDTEKREKETHDDYEKRTWREKAHYDEKTREVFIPPMALKMALSEAAKMLSLQVPGRGKATYTKHFEAGVLCTEPVMLGIDVDTLKGTWINANSDGVRGSGKRVKRCFPEIPAGWCGTARFYVLDDTVTPSVFEKHLREAGNFIGIGRFRPRQGGYLGRFAVDGFEVEEIAAAA